MLDKKGLKDKIYLILESLFCCTNSNQGRRRKGPKCHRCDLRRRCGRQTAGMRTKGNLLAEPNTRTYSTCKRFFHEKRKNSYFFCSPRRHFEPTENRRQTEPVPTVWFGFWNRGCDMNCGGGGVGEGIYIPLWVQHTVFIIVRF